MFALMQRRSYLAAMFNAKLTFNFENLRFIGKYTHMHIYVYKHLVGQLNWLMAGSRVNTLEQLNFNHTLIFTQLNQVPNKSVDICTLVRVCTHIGRPESNYRLVHKYVNTHKAKLMKALQSERSVFLCMVKHVYMQASLNMSACAFYFTKQ